MKPNKKIIREIEGLLNEGRFSEAEEIKRKFDWTSEITGTTGSHGIKNCLDEQIVPNALEDFKYIGLQYIAKGYFLVAQKDNQWGVLKADCFVHWVIEPIYDYISFPNDLLAVSKDGKWGVLDLTSNEFVIPLEQDSVSVRDDSIFYDGIAFYEKDGKIGLLNEYGQKTEAIFAKVDFTDNVHVLFNGKWGYANEIGEFTERRRESAFCFIRKAKGRR